MADESSDVLVVEDDREINALIGAYAEICGLKYRHAYDGRTAIEAAEATPPRAVILDLMLPDVDGFEVCRRMRGSPKTARTPIIILSALGGEADKRRGREVGANEHLTKPFDPDEFMTVLRRHTNGKASAG